MSRPIRIEFIYRPDINPHWQYCIEDKKVLAVGGKEKFYEAVKDAARVIGVGR